MMKERNALSQQAKLTSLLLVYGVPTLSAFAIARMLQSTVWLSSARMRIEKVAIPLSAEVFLDLLLQESVSTDVRPKC